MSSFEENTSSLVRAMHSKRRHSTLLTPLDIDSLGDAIIIIITIIIAVQFQRYVYLKKSSHSQSRDIETSFCISHAHRMNDT